MHARCSRPGCGLPWPPRDAVGSCAGCYAWFCGSCSRLCGGCDQRRCDPCWNHACSGAKRPLCHGTGGACGAPATVGCPLCEGLFCPPCASGHVCWPALIEDDAAEYFGSSKTCSVDEGTFSFCPQEPRPDRLAFGVSFWNLHKLGASSSPEKRDSILGALGLLFGSNPWLDAVAVEEVQKTGIDVLAEELPRHGLKLLDPGPLLIGETPLSDKELLRSIAQSLPNDSNAHRYVEACRKRLKDEEEAVLDDESRREICTHLRGPLIEQLAVDRSQRTMVDRYTEWYPLIVRADSALILVGIELYWQDGSVQLCKPDAFQGPDVYTARRTLFRSPRLAGTLRHGDALDGMFRPVIVYVVAHPGWQHVVKIAVSHTSPSGTEFIRFDIFHGQLQAVLNAAELDQQQSGAFWVFGGDLYLSPEARVMMEKHVSGGRTTINAERNKLAAELQQSGWTQKKGGTYTKDATTTRKGVTKTRTIELTIGLDSLRNVLRLTFERQLPGGFAVAAPLSGTHLGDEHKWQKADRADVVDLKVQVADFLVCSKRWTVCTVGVFKDPELVAHSGGGLVLVDAGNLVLRAWSLISDHAPVGAYLANYPEAQATAKQILGYDARMRQMAALDIEVMKAEIELRLQLLEDLVAQSRETQDPLLIMMGNQHLARVDQLASQLRELGHYTPDSFTPSYPRGNGNDGGM